MGAELETALVGAAVGAAITAVASFATFALGEWAISRRTARDARIALAREIIRHRGDQLRVAAPLNELPVLFGRNKSLMRLYRQFLDGSAETRTAVLIDIVMEMSSVLGVRKSVSVSDLQRFLYVAN